MKLDNKKFEDIKETKGRLKEAGRELREKSTGSKDNLMLMLDEMYESTPENKKNKIKCFFKKGLVLAPVIGAAVIILAIAALEIINRPYSGPVYTKQYIESSSLDQDIFGRKAPSDPSDIAGYSQSGTFKNKFLSLLGRHEAGPDEIAERGSILEKDLNIDLITTKKEDDAEKFAKNTFESLEGYVENIRQYYYSHSKRIRINGKIPADKMEDLRQSLKDYVEKSNYYRENIKAQSRTEDIIVIEEKIKEVEESIEYLENAIEQETNQAKKEELQKKLEENRAYLQERQETEEEIMQRVEYVDVNLVIEIIPSFWKANDFKDIKRFYKGFEAASLWEKLLFNALLVAIWFFRILSYTFWLIPIAAWLIIRKRRKKRFLRELD